MGKDGKYAKYQSQILKISFGLMTLVEEKCIKLKCCVFFFPTRFMVGCGRCDDWFHGDCVGLSLSQAQQMGEEDKEYVCVKCCAEEDKKTEIVDPDISENQTKVEVQSEDKTMEYEKLGLSKHTPTNDKTKYMDDTVKHKVKILKRVSFSLMHFVFF